MRSKCAVYGCDSCRLDIHVREIGHATDMNVHPAIDRFGIGNRNFMGAAWSE